MIVCYNIVIADEILYDILHHIHSLNYYCSCCNYHHCRIPFRSCICHYCNYCCNCFVDNGLCPVADMGRNCHRFDYNYYCCWDDGVCRLFLFRIDFLYHGISHRHGPLVCDRVLLSASNNC